MPYIGGSDGGVPPFAITGWPECAFWDWSLSFYGSAGVSTSLIRLQDECGLDINLLLYCLWSAIDGPGEIDPPTMQRARAMVHEWQREVIQPLRAVRRRCGEGFDVVPRALSLRLKSRSQGMELDAEHVEQILLGRLQRGRGGSPNAVAVAVDNLLLYLGSERVEFNDSVVEATVHILRAAFPRRTQSKLRALLLGRDSGPGGEGPGD